MRNQHLSPFFKNPNQVSLFIKREDLLHPEISGNKYRKLKYNLERAQQENHHTLLTFGGAFSNHLLATAAAGKEYGFRTIGLVRGEELAVTSALNPTLKKAQDYGMQLHFVDRNTYRNKNQPDFINSLSATWGNFYLLPEGGTNEWAVKGCEEILTPQDTIFDYICVSVGTGGTLAGIANSASKHQQVLGFSALKGDFLKTEISRWTKHTNWQLTDAYALGGYAKTTDQLIAFMNYFKEKTDIPLDPIYTGKMMFGLVDLIQQGKFPKNSRILAVHTGGLQGIEGMNRKLIQQKRLLID